MRVPTVAICTLASLTTLGLTQKESSSSKVRPPIPTPKPKTSQAAVPAHQASTKQVVAIAVPKTATAQFTPETPETSTASRELQLNIPKTESPREPEPLKIEPLAPVPVPDEVKVNALVSEVMQSQGIAGGEGEKGRGVEGTKSSQRLSSSAFSSEKAAPQPLPPELALAMQSINVHPSPSAPSLTLAVTSPPQEYTLGAGDRVQLDIVKVPEFSKEYQVLADGSLNLPMIGRVSVRGLTLEQAGSAIAARYNGVLQEPVVTVNLVTSRPVSVAISGEVDRPGSYTFGQGEAAKSTATTATPTVTQAIQLAGGFKQAADLRQVQVRRPQKTGTQVFKVNLWNLLQTGDLTQDLSLRDGDSIFIPTSTKVNLAESSQLAAASFATKTTAPVNIAVVGEVAHPGLQKVVGKGESGGLPTVTQALQTAGGITQSADVHRVQIRRSTSSGAEQIISVDLWQLLQAGDLRQDAILQQGDTIMVPTATALDRGEAVQLAAANFAASTAQPVSIAVVGEVPRPGPYTVSSVKGSGNGASNDASNGNTGGAPTVTQAILQAGGIMPTADIRRIQVQRLTRSGAGQTINVDLWQLLQAGNPSQDPILQQGDTILIPKATALNPGEATQIAAASFSPATMKVNIVGEVERPGAVEVPPNTPLNQALLASGGFSKRASKGSVQLIHLNQDGTVQRRKVSIDLTKGVNEKDNPILQNNDVVVVGTSGLAKFSDTLDSVLGPLGRLLPLFLLF